MKFVKRYRCEQCRAKFSRQEDLMNHKQIVHGGKKYDCRECGMYFSSMEEMRSHLQKRHSYKN